MNWKPRKELNRIEISIDVDVVNSRSWLRRRDAKETKGMAERIVQEINRHVDLTDGFQRAHVHSHEVYDVICPYCERDVTYVDDVKFLSDGSLGHWQGMPQCCERAMLEWAIDNPYEDRTLFFNWFCFMLPEWASQAGVSDDYCIMTSLAHSLGKGVYS